MAIALVAHTSAGSLDTNGITSSAIDTTGATLLVLSVAYYTGVSTPVISDSKGNTWTALTLHPAVTNVANRLYYCAGGTVGAGHTFTVSSATVQTYPVVSVTAWSGTHAAPLDVQSGVGSGGSVTTLQPGSVTPSQAGSLILVGMAFDATSTLSIGSGFTIPDQTNFNAGNSMGGGSAYLIQGAAAAINPTWTLSNTADAASAIAVFKPAAAPAQTIAVTDSHVYFSPFNWYSDGGGALAANNVKGSSTYARTSNPGAYVKFSVATPASGTVKLNLDTTMLQDLTAANCPRLAISVDGLAFTSSLLAYSASAVQVTLASGLAAATHTFVVFFQGVVLNGSNAMGDRWNDSATGSSVVKVTGLEIDALASMASQTLRTRTMLVYGDSITEGADAAGSANGAGDQDSTQTWAMLLAEALDAEVGIIAWSGCGWLVAGYGNVPALTNATDTAQHWNKHFAGQSRLVGGLFSPAPDFIVVNHGKNDSAADATVTAGVSALLTALRTAAPSARIWVVPAFDRTKATAVLAATLPANSAFLDLGTDTRLVSGASTGLFAADSTPHPNARGHADYGARLAKLAQVQVSGSGSGGARSSLHIGL